MLKDLVLRWFLESQAPLILQEGRLPEWFHGCITRKQAEELLKDKGPGCFLIRLSERSFGYILSYQGKDRCRHFVIACQHNGHYIISGDSRTHHSLVELISYYQTSEIQPFGENLTVACSTEEEKSVYDEISLAHPTSAKQSATGTNSIMTRETPGISSVTRPPKEITSYQPLKPQAKPLGPQKFLSNEWRTLSSEETDAGPERRSLLTSFEEDFGDEGHLSYSELKLPKALHKSSSDPSQDPEGPGQTNTSSRKKINTACSLTKQPDRVYCKEVGLVKTSGPEIIYSEIGLSQDMGCGMSPETQGGQFHLLPPKKAALNSPASSPPKLSPKLPNKPNVSMEPQGPEALLAPSTTCVATEKGGQKPTHGNNPPGSPRETLYGQVRKLKIHHSITSSRDNGSDTYEQIPFGWTKSIACEHDPERISRSSPPKRRDLLELASTKTGHSLKTPAYAENPYERITNNQPKGSSPSRHVQPVENTYEQIRFGLAKETEGKVTQKSEKPRRFLFTDKKIKF